MIIKNYCTGIASRLLLLALLGLAGCHSTYSAPLRTGSFGAPAAVVPGEVELGASGGFQTPEEPALRGYAGPILAVGATDWLTFEAGGEWVHLQSASGFGAMRFTLDGRNGKAKNIDVDLTIGGGGGVGGMVCSNVDLEEIYDEEDSSADDINCPSSRTWDGLEWYERYYGGAFMDVGVGFPFSSYTVVPYVRARFQITDGEGTPHTFWFSILGGAHFNLPSNVRLHVGASLMFYHNEIDPLTRDSFYDRLNVLLDVGFSFGIPTDRKITYREGRS